MVTERLPQEGRLKLMVTEFPLAFQPTADAKDIGRAVEELGSVAATQTLIQR